VVPYTFITDLSNYFFYLFSGTSAVHVIIQEGLVYGCISLQDVPSYVSFLFLSRVRDRMAEQPSLISRSYRASEYEFDRDFGPVLAQIAVS